jgi:hypothetical protein
MMINHVGSFFRSLWLNIFLLHWSYKSYLSWPCRASSVFDVWSRSLLVFIGRIHHPNSRSIATFLISPVLNIQFAIIFLVLTLISSAPLITSTFMPQYHEPFFSYSSSILNFANILSQAIYCYFIFLFVVTYSNHVHLGMLTLQKSLNLN